MVKVRIPFLTLDQPIEAFIEGRRWRTRLPVHARMLNAGISALFPVGVPTSEPDKDRAIAQATIDRWGGEILEPREPAAAEVIKGDIY